MNNSQNIAVQAGQYKRNGTIILKGGTIVTAKDLMEAKKAGVKPQHLEAYLKKQADLKQEQPVVEEVHTVEEPKKPATQWASISLDEIAAAGLKRELPKAPWYKKLFKGGDKK
jgi:hypothetical protein